MFKVAKVVMALVISASVSFSGVAFADRYDGSKNHRSSHSVKMHHVPKYKAHKHHAPNHSVVHHVYHKSPPPKHKVVHHVYHKSPTPKHKVIHHVHHKPPPPENHYHNSDEKALNMALVGLTAAIIYNSIN